METPSPEGGFTSLKDEPLPNAKGKARISDSSGNTHPRVSNLSTNPGKRRRSTEAEMSFESGLPRNQLVAKFLRVGDAPSPAIRRRPDFDHPPLSNLFITGSSETDSDLQMTTGEGAEVMSRQSSSDSGDTSFSTSTARTAPSTAPTSPDIHLTDSENSVDCDTKCDVNDAQSAAADVISSAPAGIYGSIGVAARLRPTTESEPQTGRPARVNPPPPSSESFSVRSNDPFGYMSPSSTPSASFSAVRSQRGFEQPPDFPDVSATVRATASSSRAQLNSAATNNQSPFLDGSPTQSFLSAVSIHYPGDIRNTE